jgi:hypothetical protein
MHAGRARAFSRAVRKNEWLGGKAAVLEQDGFRFDMGPTILTLPSVLKRIFAEADRDIADYLDLIPLDPQWRSFFDDGTTLDLVANVEQMRSRLVEYSGERAAMVMRGSSIIHGGCIASRTNGSSGARSAECATCSTRGT